MVYIMPIKLVTKRLLLARGHWAWPLQSEINVAGDKIATNKRLL